MNGLQTPLTASPPPQPGSSPDTQGSNSTNSSAPTTPEIPGDGQGVGTAAVPPPSHGDRARHEAECRRRVKEKGAADEKDKERGLVPIQSTYFADLVDCVGPLAQSLSYAWQDVNRRFGGGPS